MTMQATDTAVQASTIVEASIERAFSVFTEGIASWWPPEHHVAGAPWRSRSSIATPPLTRNSGWSGSACTRSSAPIITIIVIHRRRRFGATPVARL